MFFSLLIPYCLLCTNLSSYHFRKSCMTPPYEHHSISTLPHQYKPSRNTICNSCVVGISDNYLAILPSGYFPIFCCYKWYCNKLLCLYFRLFPFDKYYLQWNNWFINTLRVLVNMAKLHLFFVLKLNESFLNLTTKK